MTSKSVDFNRAAEYYDATRGFQAGVDVHIGATIAKAGAFVADSRILEVGIGTGRIGLPVSKHVRSYIGVDLSAAMMERLRAKRAGEPVYLVLADATQLPFPAHTFDGAVAVHVFHLIPNWRDALREIARVLRPGAALVHCYTEGYRHNPHTAAMQQIWDEAVPQDRATRVGVQWEQYETFLLDEGWQQKDVQVYTYPENLIPQQLLEYRAKRQGSGTWHLSDEELNRGVTALKAYIDAHFDDPNQPIVIDQQFLARAYTPPEQ